MELLCNIGGQNQPKKGPNVEQKKREAKFTVSIPQNAYNNISKICKNPFVGAIFRIENHYFQFIHKF